MLSHTQPLGVDVDGANDQPLVEAWCEQFGDAGGVSRRGELTRFPELERAIALPELQTDVLEESYLSWNGEGIEGPVQVIWRASDAGGHAQPRLLHGRG
jgi:hypothetical protein